MRIKTNVRTVLILVLILSMLFTQLVSATTAVYYEAGDLIDDSISVTIPNKPAQVDIVFCFDLTGSMGSVLSSAKSQAGQIITTLDALDVDINYGVTSHMDYTSYYDSYGYTSTYGSESSGDYPYNLDMPITDNEAAIIESINGLELAYGNDYAESYTRALYEAYADENLGWREGSKRIVITFNDAIFHDDNVYEEVTDSEYSTGGDPGRDEIMFTEDDLDFQDVMRQYEEEGIILLACRTSSSYADVWEYWTEYTGGATYLLNTGDIVEEMYTYVSTAVTVDTVTDLHVEADPDWLESSDPDQYTGPTGVDVSFDFTLEVPEGLSPGLHEVTVRLVDEDGVIFASQIIEVWIEEEEEELYFTQLDSVVDYNAPTDVVVDSDDNVFVSDFYDDCIYMSSTTDASIVFTYGSSGDGIGEFNHPSGIAIDRMDNIYVADTYNNRIVVFKDDNVNGIIDSDEWTEYGTYGNGEFEFNKPMGVFVDNNGDIYVADTYNSRIVIFDETGSWSSFGSSGTGASQFRFPYDVAVNGDSIWVSDTFNQRVSKFDISEPQSYLETYKVSFPYGLAIDEGGNVFVAKRQSGEVLCIQTDEVYGIRGYGIGEFLSPIGICFDSDNRLWVVDVTDSEVEYSTSITD